MPLNKGILQHARDNFFLNEFETARQKLGRFEKRASRSTRWSDKNISNGRCSNFLPRRKVEVFQKPKNRRRALDASSLGGRPRLGSLPRLPCQAWRVGTCFGLCPLVWISRSSCGPTNIPLDTKTAKGEGLRGSALRSSKATLVHGHLRYFVHSMHIAASEVQGSCRRLSRLFRPTCGLRASMNWAWVIICYSKACQEDPA